MSARFVFVDALRGIAALAVVLFHLYDKNLVPMTGFAFPEPLHALLSHGNLGVYVFFVISGFVIAQSLRGEVITARYVGWFALRRSIRLDPPYWATIAAMLALTLLSNHLQDARILPVPSAAAVASHLVYGQGFLGYPHIVGVFWTLCYEIQFYLVLVLVVAAIQVVARRGSSTAVAWALFAALWLLSFACMGGYLAWTDALFLHAWPYFFLGVVVNWVHHRDVPRWILFVVGGSALVALPIVPLELGCAIVTAVAIDVVGRRGALATLTLGRGLQYLGRISYSLYLVHMLVGTPSFRFGLRLFGDDLDTAHVIALVVLAITVSIVAAHVMYVVVERPAVRFAARLRTRQRGARAPAALIAEAP